MKFNLILVFLFCILISAKSWAVLTGTSPCSNQEVAYVYNVPSVYVTDFGAKGDASTDNLAPLKAAIEYASRCEIPAVYIPNGNYYFYPAPNDDGIFLPSGITLQGQHPLPGQPNSTRLTVVPNGNNFQSFFWARNQDHITLTDLQLWGNGTYNSNPKNNYGGGAFWIISENSTAFGPPRPLTGFLLQRCDLQNFIAASWVMAQVSNNSVNTISNVNIVGNNFYSAPGDDAYPAQITYSADAIALQGSQTNTTGLVKSATISGNHIYASYMKKGVAIWSGVNGVVVSGNYIYDNGMGAPTAFETGAYAVSVYSNAYDAGGGGIDPTNINITGNFIENAKTCGIYTAMGGQLTITGNFISGQTDPDNGTLPKGAIALNGPASATVIGNTLSGNYIGIGVAPLLNDAITIENNTITNILAKGYGMYLDIPSSYSTLYISNIKIDGAGPGGVIRAGTTSVFGWTLGSYFGLNDIVEAHTTNKMTWVTRYIDSKTKKMDYLYYHGTSTKSGISQLNSYSPWGVKITNFWSCPSYSGAAAQISSVNPGGCSLQTNF